MPTIPQQDFTEQAELLAAAEERKRLARELHDSFSHALTLSIVQLENATKLMAEEPQQAQELIETVREHLVSGLDDLRLVLTTLHNHKIGADNLLSSLRRLISEFAAATGIIVHTQLQPKLPPLSDAQATTLYRTVQEALTNTCKHAQAQNIWMRLDSDDDALTLNVRDDGQRFAPSSSSGYGLKGLKERAAQLGGTLLMIKPPEGGVSVTLRLPLKEAVYA